MKLLQVPTVELEARIKQELEANPALEEGVEEDTHDDLLEGEENEREESLEEFDFDEYLDDETPDYKTSISNHGADVEDNDIPLGAGSTFREQLLSQLALHQLDEHLAVKSQKQLKTFLTQKNFQEKEPYTLPLLQTLKLL